VDRAQNQNRVTQLEFALTDGLQQTVRDALFGLEPETMSEERGFLGLISAGQGLNRRTLYLRGIVPQEPGWVRWQDDGLGFDAKYFSRALTAANGSKPASGLVIVHSHPGGTGFSLAPRPSSPDLYHERRLLCQASRALQDGAPVASGIVSGVGRWRVREYRWPRATTPEQVRKKAYGPDGGSYRDAESVRIVGGRLQIARTAPVLTRPNMDAVDSTLRLWGAEGQQLLRRLRIGIAGAGGVGGMVIEQLARLGVGELVVVDYDTLETGNMNRAQGAKRRDSGKPKVDYVSRLAKESASAAGFKVSTFEASVAEWGGLRPLLDCDAILNAADSPFARQVLDHASYAYEIPLIDGGTVFLVEGDGRISGRSQVSEAGPGRPCLECQRIYTREEATMARETPRQQGPQRYVYPTGELPPGGAIPRAPSVISYNGVVASLMVQRLLRIALGFPPFGRAWQQRFYAESGEIRWGPVLECEPECPKSTWIGLGDGHPTPVGIDPFLEELRSRNSNPRGLKSAFRRSSSFGART
jgi:molybdopterin/thiamine biosynthesis adenylyltransferase